jgi:predicted  nucleic acid-binding Zn-ribbon protein
MSEENLNDPNVEVVDDYTPFTDAEGIKWTYDTEQERYVKLPDQKPITLADVKADVRQTMDNVDDHRVQTMSLHESVDKLHDRIGILEKSLADLHLKFDAAMKTIESLGGQMQDNPMLKAMSKMFGVKG